MKPSVGITAEFICDEDEEVYIDDYVYLSIEDECILTDYVEEADYTGECYEVTPATIRREKIEKTNNKLVTMNEYLIIQHETLQSDNPDKNPFE